jgi:Fuc2NAc and GlcNAc transferase
MNGKQWMALFAPALATAGAVFVLTALARVYAFSRRIVDVPNARSSHTVPTPRGGGAAIVAGFMAISILTRNAPSPCPPELFWALLGGGGLVAAIGLADDHRHVAARWRLLAHFIAAAGIVLLASSTKLPHELFILSAAVETLFLVWMVNLYNFMDGIDGLASIEAVCVCGGGALIQAMNGGVPGVCALSLLLAAAAAGFLPWNWPRARIFMGDVGSGFLGLAIGTFALFSRPWSASFWSWVILAGVFVGDATFTLARRALAGERLYEAHRDHAYQHAARRWGHPRVTLAVAVINIGWLWPLAAATSSGALPALATVPLAYVPLLTLAAWQRAGKCEH